MKKALTAVGVALHVISCVLFALYERVLFTRPSIFLIGILVMFLSFIIYYVEAARSINERANMINILKLVFTLMSVVFVIAFLIVLFGAKDKLEVFYFCFAVYYLLLLILQITLLLKRESE